VRHPRIRPIAAVVACAIILTIAARAHLAGDQAPTQTPPAAATPAQARPVFRSGVNLVLVDVVVRDRSGAFVKDLAAEDFELFEDGVRQQIVTFAVEEITQKAAPLETASTLTTATIDSVRATPPAVATTPTPDTPATTEPRPLTSEDVAGRRLLTLVFDTSSMQPEDVQKAIDSAAEWVGEKMTTADLVAVASIDSDLRVLTDFTSDKERLRTVLSAFAATDGTAYATVDASTAATDDAARAATEAAADSSVQELDTFNNDVRLRALKALAEALQPIQQKKALIYFSSGMQRSGTDNQIELRAAVNAALKANVAIYPVDSRGLQAVVPGGSARQGSRGGIGAFSGRGVADQFTQLAAQQETLTALASDTGGTAFTDSNDFGEAFTRVQRDISSYYMLGFSSTNSARDGRFRRLSVRVRKRSGLRLDAKNGYYADRDFAHTARSDRELLLQEQLAAPIPVTDVPLFVTAGWFRLATDRYYVPISVAVPGASIPRATDKTTLDIAGFIRDERGAPVGRIRDTLTVPPASADTLAARQVLYQTGVTLPPGRFQVKVVVRENVSGQMGTFEAPILVPELKQSPVKVSSLVLATQLQNVSSRRTPNPLVRDGLELVPNLTHIVNRSQKVYFYYEVYEPAAEAGASQLRTNLSFYRGRVKVFETPIVERTSLDVADRRAAVFQFEVPPDSFTPGLYTCQVNIIDAVAGRFAFPRLLMYVR
jgi:VWFA-related protein